MMMAMDGKEESLIVYEMKIELKEERTLTPFPFLVPSLGWPPANGGDKDHYWG